MSGFKQLTGKERSGFDTEHEQRAVNTNYGKAEPQLDRLQDMNTQMIMEKAMNDRIKDATDVVLDTVEEAVQDAAAAQELKPDEDGLEAIRARRRKQMKDRQEKEKEYKQKGHGVYDEIVEEEFLKTVTSSNRCVVHFYHKQFERCKIMDMHLKKMAPKFLGTRFVNLNAEKAPFFVQKLAIKTLPTAVFFIDGVAIGKQVGFMGLPNGDEFKSVDLARNMQECAMLEENFDSDDESW